MVFFLLSFLIKCCFIAADTQIRPKQLSAFSWLQACEASIGRDKVSGFKTEVLKTVQIFMQTILIAFRILKLSTLIWPFITFFWFVLIYPVFCVSTQGYN